MLPLLTPKLPEVPDRRSRDRDSVQEIFDGIARERRSHRDRRSAPRLAVMLNLELENDEAGSGLRAVYRTHDLSAIGVAIRSGVTPAIGSKVKLRIYLADDKSEPLELSGEVVGAFDSNGGARVKFVKAPLKQARRLHRFLK